MCARDEAGGTYDLFSFLFVGSAIGCYLLAALALIL